jgi:transposase
MFICRPRGGKREPMHPYPDAQAITLGVDTHKDAHVAVALDGLGRRQGTLSIPTTPEGYKKLVDWTSEFGPLEHAGIEGTGSFGAGLTRFLRALRG